MKIVYQLVIISSSSWTVHNFAENSEHIGKSHCESALGD